MDRGAWPAAVPGVAKRQTWLSDWTTSIHPDQALETCNPERPVGRQEQGNKQQCSLWSFKRPGNGKHQYQRLAKSPAPALQPGNWQEVWPACWGRCPSPGPTARASLAGGPIYLQQWQQPSPRPTQPPLYYWAQTGVDLSTGAGSAACFIFLPCTWWPKRPRPSSFCTSPPSVADGHQWHQAGQRGRAAGSKREI